MKLSTVAAYACEFGRLEFQPVEQAPHGYKVWWRKTGQDAFRRVAWIDRDQRPNLKLARFFIRKAVAQDRGEPEHKYCDSNTDPAPLTSGNGAAHPSQCASPGSQSENCSPCIPVGT